MRSYQSVSRSTQTYCACFQIMYGQDGSVSDANARSLQTSATENTTPTTIPVSTVFIGKLLASSGIHAVRPRAALSMLNDLTRPSIGVTGAMRSGEANPSRLILRQQLGR